MLYIGDVKFVDDDRFELLPGNGYSDWTLRFRLIREADAGNYECQISTSPTLSQTFTLNVVGKYSLHLYRIIRGGASSKMALRPSIPVAIFRRNGCLHVAMPLRIVTLMYRRKLSNSIRFDDYKRYSEAQYKLISSLNIVVATCHCWSLL